MKLTDIRPDPSYFEDIKTNKQSRKDCYYLSIEEIESIKSQYVKPTTKQDVEDFVAYLTNPNVYLRVHSDRKHTLVQQKKDELDHSLKKYKMNKATHGKTYETKKIAHHKSTCRELVQIMLPDNGDIGFGKPYRVEELSDIIIKTTQYRPKARSIPKRFSDLRLCSRKYTILYFKGKIIIDKRTIRDNFFIMLDNGLGLSGIITKEEMLEDFPDYKWLDYFR